MPSAEIKPTTFRLEPTLKAGLKQLSKATKTSQNDLVNFALKEYVGRQSALVASQLEATAKKLKSYRLTDPGFKKAILDTAKAENAGFHDPAQGVLVEEEQEKQSLVRDILHG